MEDKRRYGMTDCKKDKEFFSLSLTQPYRSQYGSANPASILGPAMIATFFSTLAGVVFAKFMYALPQTHKHARNPKLPPQEIPSTYSRSQADLSKKKKGGIFH